MISKIFINIFVAIVEVFAIIEVFRKSNRQQYTNWVVMSVFFAIYILFSIIATLYIANSMIMLLANSAILFGLSFAYDIKIVKRLLIIVLFNVLSMALEILVTLVIAAINNVTVDDLLADNIASYAVIALICKFLLYILMIITAQLMQGKKGYIQWKYLGLHLIVPLASFLVLFIQSYFALHSESKAVQTLVVISSLVLIVANIAVLVIFELLNKKERQIGINAFKVKELEKERTYYENTIRSALQSNKVMHDLKHKLFEINENLSGSDNAKEMIEEMCGIIKGAQLVEYTTVNGLNVLLNYKFKEINDKNIDLKYKILLGSEVNIENMDLCVLIGNLLDNAIEATIKAEIKEISFNLTQKNNYIVLRMKNTTKNSDVKIGKSTKSDGEHHGIGLNSINDIVDKYDGNMEFELKDGYFDIYLILKNEVK